MIIKNGLVWEESGSFRKKELVVDTTTHRIAETAEDDTVFDAEGLYVIPGLVDVHIHGARGHDFSDGNSKGLAEIAQYLHSCGVTSFCPTSMTLPEEQLTAAFATINDVPDAAGYAHIAGIHMEGPYLSPEKKGAQKASYLHAPDAAMFRRLSAASGNKIRIITIAPELPGSDAFIREFKDTVAISLGHSTASYEIAENAFAAGANHVTHLFNAMPPLHHRDPGIIGAAADCPHAMAEIICDGIHIHPSVIRNAFRMFGNDRMILISDAMRATGMEDGEYELGGQPVIKKGRLATLKDGTIAGSATNLFDCMKNAVQFGIPLGVAVKAATCNPAKSIECSQEIGTLAVATGDQHQLAFDVRAQAFNGGQCRTDVGGLGIVVIADTGALQHELNAVLYSLELFYGFADQIHRHTHADAHGYRCHHVLIVVFAEKLHIRLYV